MLSVNILTDPFTSQNTRAFLSPLLRAAPLLRDSGVKLKCHYAMDAALFDCDVLAVNSNYFWNAEAPGRQETALDSISEIVDKVDRLLYFDRSSTPSSVNADVLALVPRYYKTSLLKDRALYRRPLYGQRVFSDYYHRTRGIEDDEPTYSAVLPEADLAKVHLSWNTALANYSLFGPRLSSFYRRLALKWWLAPPRHFEPPSANRPVDVSCRITTNYRYASVAYQRQVVAQRLAAYCAADRLSKPAYFKELRQSRIVVSPFGYSELNYKDYETFICGALLLKPDMSHIETFPDLYHDRQTFVAHGWQLDDVVEKVEDILAHYDDYLEVARNGQAIYRRSVASREGSEVFARRFLAILDDTPGNPR